MLSYWVRSLASWLRLAGFLLFSVAAIRLFPLPCATASSSFFLPYGCLCASFCACLLLLLSFGSSPHWLSLTLLHLCLSLTLPVPFRFALIGLPPLVDFSPSFFLLGLADCSRVGCGSSFVFWGPLFPLYHPRLPILRWRLLPLASASC